MIALHERFEVDSPLDRVWPLLSDPAVVVTCVPGAALVADQGGGIYAGTLSVRFGPIVAMFRGTAQIKFDHDAHACTIEARGQDQRGASGASASAAVATVEQEGRTLVSIDGGFNVTGPLAQFARTGGQHLAREILAEFSRNFALRLAETAAPAGSHAAAAATPPPPPARELSGFTLIWRALLAWLRGRTVTGRE